MGVGGGNTLILNSITHIILFNTKGRKSLAILFPKKILILAPCILLSERYSAYPDRKKKMEQPNVPNPKLRILGWKVYISWE